MRKTILLLMLAGCTIAACKKKDASYPVSPLVERYFNYLPGSYWIYKDSLTGTVDSFVVSKNSLQVLSENAGPYDVITIDISIYNNGQLNFASGAKWNLNGDALLFYFENNLTFTYPFAPVGYTIYDPSDSIVIVDQIPACLNSGKIYDTVEEIYARRTETGLPTSGLYFLNKDAGIIKMTINNPNDSVKEIWELQRYKIIR